MGRNQRAVSIRDQQEDKGNKQRHDHRQARNFRQDEGGFILRHGAGPIDQRAGFDPAVVTRIQITSSVEVKTASVGLLNIKKTGMTDKPRDDADSDQEAGNNHPYAYSHVRLWTMSDGCT